MVIVNKSISNAKTREAVVKLVDMYCDLLGIDQNSVTIHILLDKRLKNSYAICYGFSNNVYRISFSYDTKYNFSRILAHELTHVKQFVKNELKEDSDLGTIEFGGKMYSMSDSHHESRQFHFHNLPFEREAILNERRLYSKIPREFRLAHLRTS